MKLLVVGKGERADYYHTLVETRKVAKQVLFKGLVEDVRRFMQLRMSWCFLTA